jgi:hypothetical protein
MELHYVSHKLGEEAEKQLDYRVNLLSTFCRYGGMRWWFQCPDIQCNRRVRILYKSGAYFVCRKCAKLWYDSQRYLRQESKPLIDLCKGERLYETLKRHYYRGKPTRKFRRYLMLTHATEAKEQVEMQPV